MKTRKFIDSVVLHIKAGNGGNGVASFRREKYVPRGGPDGGDGGHGGSIYIQADAQLDSLEALYFRPHQNAEHGGHGRGQRCHGRSGKKLILRVPCGTEAYDATDTVLIGEVLGQDDQLLLAQGGRGGLGNVHFKTSSHQAPQECTPGTKGEEREIRLVLKTISDISLVGYPNSGKSTLLSKLSEAHPKIAAYPFTTLNPIIGTLVFENYNKLRIADIPGLIDGAHQGVGLGHDFLQHIERTHFLLYVIDMAGMDGRHPADDYRQLKEELRLYDSNLIERPYLLLANKMDQHKAQERLKEFIEQCGEKPLELSALQEHGLTTLRQKLHHFFFEKSSE